MAKATLINSAGKKVVVEAGSVAAKGYFGQGYQLMGASGAFVAPSASPVPMTSPITPAAPAVSNQIVSGLQAADARQKAGTANATDIQNLNYAKTKGIDYSGINNIADANAAINDGQAADAAGATADGTPPTRKTTADIMAEVSKMVTPAGTTAANGTVTPAAPAPSNLAQDLTNYRSSYGVTDLETQLSDLKTQQNDLLAASKKQSFAERSKTVAMNVINGRIGQEEQAANERLTVLNNSITTVTDQLNTKYKVIDSLMSAKQIDYNNAVTSYNSQMSTNIAMFNAAKSIEENTKTEEAKVIDTARSNAQITLNALTATGATYDTLTPEQQTNLTKLGVQSGLGANFFSAVLKVSAGKDILTTITSADDTKASIIYKDGTVKTISTGLPARKTTSSGTTVDPEENARKKEVSDFKAKAADLIEKMDNRDVTWATAYASMKAQFPGLEGSIDEILGGGYDEAQGGWYGRAKTANSTRK